MIPKKQSNPNVLFSLLTQIVNQNRQDIEVSWNRGTPKSSILDGFSLTETIQLLGSPISGNPHIDIDLKYSLDPYGSKHFKHCLGNSLQ